MASGNRSIHMAGGGGKRKWSNFVFLFAFLIVVAEIGLVGRLDIAKNAAMIRNWTHSFHFPSSANRSSGAFVDYAAEAGIEAFDAGAWEDDRDCIDWLEREDNIPYSRDFAKIPILVSGPAEDWGSCSVGCKFGHSSDQEPDATFGSANQPGKIGVLRSMESSHYYLENGLDLARRRGYGVVMTTSLSSDVPVGYFSWAEYDIMAPMQPKTAEALAAAFISNCGAKNFRLQALEKLESLNIKIDSYGSCHRNHDGRVDKLQTLKRYKFSLAFENSNEEDYVTEKFFQSLVAGAIPVVVGAPNIHDFAPSPGSLLHIRELEDAGTVAERMEYLAAHPDAYNQSVRWKYEGPSDSFKALIDMAAVHSSCRLCIHLATKLQEKEERSSKFQKRPCKCTRKSGILYHLYVRERGRFEMESIFLRSASLTLKALESAVLKKFKALNHVPVWKKERPASIRGGNELKIYKIYPIGLTQRQALYTFQFSSDADLQRYIESKPCTKLEVIFV